MKGGKMNIKKPLKISKKKAGPQTIAPGQKVVKLPQPAFNKGGSVVAALKNRKTSREIGSRKLSLNLLSGILWAANGINRPKGPFGEVGRTAASASNSQEIDIYAAMEEGTYLFDPKANTLILVSEKDLRNLAISAGQAPAGSNAPVRLIYVVDIEKFSKAGYQEPGLYDPEIQKSYYFVDTGLIASNVYLFCASQGLATWFHNCNKPSISNELNLRPFQRPLFGQTIGFLAK
jgi:hypothetical protein